MNKERKRGMADEEEIVVTAEELAAAAQLTNSVEGLDIPDSEEEMMAWLLDGIEATPTQKSAPSNLIRDSLEDETARPGWLGKSAPLRPNLQRAFLRRRNGHEKRLIQKFWQFIPLKKLDKSFKNTVLHFLCLALQHSNVGQFEAAVQMTLAEAQQIFLFESRHQFDIAPALQFCLALPHDDQKKLFIFLKQLLKPLDKEKKP